MAESSVSSKSGRPETAHVRELVGYLYKAVKTILLYPPTSALPGEFKQQLHQRLETYLNEHGPLALTVRGDQLVHEGETVHEEAGGDDNFIATLTRDGIQKLTFLPGIEREEIDSFLAIVKKIINERSEDDDLVTLLWEAGFVSIRYEAISEIESVDYEAMERQLRERQQAADDEPSGINYSQIVLDESSEPQPEGDPATADAPEGRSIDTVDVSRIVGDLSDLSDDLSQVDTYLREAASFDAASSTIGIVFEILIGEEDVPAFRESCGILDNLYDRFVLQTDFESALKVYEGLTTLEEAEATHSPARAKRLAESRIRTVDKMRVNQLTAAINENPDCDVISCQALLQRLPVEVLPHLVAALGDMEHYPARKVICDVLAERGADRVDVIGNGIFDKRWYVARNIANVLGQIGGPRAATYLGKAIGHSDERVRQEVVDALLPMDPSNSSQLLRSVLDDAKPELRLKALRALADRKDPVTGDMAEGIVTDRAFRRRDPTEQKEWLVALASIRGESALPLFRKLIGGFSLFDRTAKQRLRKLTVLALGEGEGEAIESYLEELSRARDQEVRDTAIRALHKMHKDARGEGFQ